MSGPEPAPPLPNRYASSRPLRAHAAAAWGQLTAILVHRDRGATRVAPHNDTVTKLCAPTTMVAKRANNPKAGTRGQYVPGGPKPPRPKTGLAAAAPHPRKQIHLGEAKKKNR